MENNDQGEVLSVNECSTTLSELSAVCAGLAKCDKEECKLYPVCIEHKKLYEIVPQITEIDALLVRTTYNYFGDCEVYRDEEGRIWLNEFELFPQLLQCIKPGELCHLSDLLYL